MRKWMDIINESSGFSKSRIDELNLPTTRSDAEIILQNAGYESLGGGSYGAVFQKENAPYVLKLFTWLDAGYIEFVKLAQSHPNTHFPKFFGKLIKVTPTYYAVRMERLEPCQNAMPISTMLQRYLLHRDGMEKYTANPDYRKKLEAAIAFVNENPSLKTACDLIIDNIINDEIWPDMSNPANLMMRRNTIVLSDPVSPR